MDKIKSMIEFSEEPIHSSEKKHCRFKSGFWSEKIFVPRNQLFKNFSIGKHYVRAQVK